MIKRYGQLPKVARWFLFIPVWALLGALSSYVLKTLAVSLTGGSVLGYSFVGFFQASLSTCLMFFLIPKGRKFAAWVIVALNVLNLFWVEREPPLIVSALDVDFDFLLSGMVLPYTMAIVGSFISALLLTTFVRASVE